ncbi:MAG: hypothetical protein E6Q67_05185 [Roseateles sp.]|nr:MAG: hypothetical protein E6Q67_05185 [Roseateles sp.]
MSRTAAQIAGAQRRTLRAMRERLLTMADEWEEVDEFARGELTGLADKAEEVAVAISPEPRDPEVAP